jgi:hypothetical protein
MRNKFLLNHEEYAFLHEMLEAIEMRVRISQSIQPDLTGQLPEFRNLLNSILLKMERSHGKIREGREEEREGTEGICGEQEDKAPSYFQLFHQISQSIR